MSNWKLEIGNCPPATLCVALRAGKLRRARRGFGLIEVVIASGILVIVAGASLALSNTVAKGNLVLADRTAANFLAVEGIEAVHQLRDTNFIDQNPSTIWNSGLDTGTYGLTPPNNFTKKWQLASTPDTTRLNNVDYTRSIKLSDRSSSDARKLVVVTIAWTGVTGPQTLTLQTILANSNLGQP